MKRITVYWNFTNFHESVMEAEYGRQWYRKVGNGPQPEAIDVRSLVEEAEKHGTIVNNVAYGNWQNFGAYASVLRDCNVTLLQVFPQPRGRQDTVTEQLIEGCSATMKSDTRPDACVLIGGANNCLPLGEAAKASGVELHAIHLHTEDSRDWEDAVNGFTSYHDVARPIQGATSNFKSPQETHETLIRVFVDLQNQYGNDWVRQVKIKPVLLRYLPDFQEADYGYSSFGAYLSDQREVLERRQLPNVREAEYALLEELSSSVADTQKKASDDPASMVPYYLRVAAQQGVRMPPPSVMWIGIDIYASFLESDQIFDSFGDLDDECLHQLKQDIPEATLTDAKKIRQVLFKCYLFRPSKDGTIGFQDQIQHLEDIEDRYFRLMLARIGNNVRTPVNYTALSLALTGEDKSTTFLEELHGQLEQTAA